MFPERLLLIWYNCTIYLRIQPKVTPIRYAMNRVASATTLHRANPRMHLSRCGFWHLPGRCVHYSDLYVSRIPESLIINDSVQGVQVQDIISKSLTCSMGAISKIDSRYHRRIAEQGWRKLAQWRKRAQRRCLFQRLINFFSLSERVVYCRSRFQS